MKIKVFLLIVFAQMTSTLFGQVTNDIVIGERVEFESKILNETRTILIHYPDTVIDKSKHYPVLYCVDGEYRFLSTFGTVDYHSKIRQIPKMIIVSIENIDRESRKRDMTPPDIEKIDSTPISIKTNAELFLNFIESEVMPYIEQNYNPLDYRVIAGHSFGGLLSGYCFLTRRNLFNAYIVSDPSFWYNDWIILRLARWKIWDEYDNKTFYITVSEKDGIQKESIKLFTEILRGKEPDGLKWKLDNIDRDHGSAFIDGMSNGLLYIFNDWKNWEEFK